jgi:hypothetical protein
MMICLYVPFSEDQYRFRRSAEFYLAMHELSGS